MISSLTSVFRVVASVVATGAALAALTGGAREAAAFDFTRHEIMVGVKKNMEATLFVPQGPGPFPQVMVLHTSGGISEADRGYCGNLAREGYICIAPAFLRAHGITTGELRRLSFTTEARPILEDFREIFGELMRMPQAKPNAVGVIGFSNGGFFAALIASFGRIQAAVAYYGAFDGANTDPSLSHMREHWTATSSPLLILAGENDTTIGNQTPRRLAEIIQAAGGRCELKMYPNAGHGFDRAGDTGAGNTAAAIDAKQRTLAFLRANGVQ